MLILPQGHGAGRPAMRALTRRERWIVGSVAAIVAALAVVAVVSIGARERKSASGCVEVTFPIAIGGQELYACGQRARSLCTAVDRPGGLSGQAGRAVALECRRIGLPVGTD